MSAKFRIGCGVVSGVLAVWALALLFTPITLTFYGEDELEVECKSVVQAGWNSKIFYEGDGTRSYSYREVKGDIPLAEQGSSWEHKDRMEGKCDRKRTSNVAWAAVLLAPAGVLASLSVSAGRKH
ncbi:hypothetical protein HGA13_04015 [Nocardia speluncae]|uniref:Uncharacterized protein n=1 Tax=Nocardia speluncae TaxID=419477 RepID=A0A846XC80_9NOCA|nr:hypothetical protein [Nocardia speluncae]NKY32243.1 hypothetical protein [Nocardia speluncae]